MYILIIMIAFRTAPYDIDATKFVHTQEFHSKSSCMEAVSFIDKNKWDVAGKLKVECIKK